MKMSMWGGVADSLATSDTGSGPERPEGRHAHVPVVFTGATLRLKSAAATQKAPRYGSKKGISKPCLRSL